jgi:hypothetical protein
LDDHTVQVVPVETVTRQDRVKDRIVQDIGQRRLRHALGHRSSSMDGHSNGVALSSHPITPALHNWGDFVVRANAQRRRSGGRQVVQVIHQHFNRWCGIVQV